MKKIILLLSALLLFNSCGRYDPDRKIIMFLHYWTGDMAQGIDELSASVNKQQKEIEVIATPLEHEEFKVNIRLLMESKNPPDIFTYWAGAKTKYLVDLGYISPISGLFKSQINIEDFDQSVLNACSYNGEIYMLPLTRHYVGFFYNKHIFRDNNISVPDNWEQFIKAAETLRDAGVVPIAMGTKNKWPAQFWFDYILLRTAGFDYRDDLMNKSARYTDLEVLKTMDIWKDLLERGLFNSDYQQETWSGAAEMLAESKAAVTLMGTWIMPYLDELGLVADIDYGFFPFPEIDSQIDAVSLGPIDGILISEQSDKKEQAEKVLIQLASIETQQTFNGLSGAIAPHNGVNDKRYSSLQLEIKQLIRASSYWAFNYDLATEPLTSEAGLDFFVDFLDSPENYEVLLEELQASLSE